MLNGESYKVKNVEIWEKCILFLLGIIGEDFFMYVHKVIVLIKPEMFGIICTIITAFICISQAVQCGYENK